jgi:hypothetical protein
MAFELGEVVPWGRSFEEYCEMFALGEEDLARKCLGCGDGPASFNATLTSRGGTIVSVDPVYRFSAEEIAGRIAETFGVVMEQTRQNADEFIWTRIASPDELAKVRMKAMADFLLDFARGKEVARYVAGELPELPFPDDEFDLALCSHFLFLYSQQFDLDFHLRSLRELCRVAREVRVFPLLELGALQSRHLDTVVSRLANEGYEVGIEQVEYEFQRGGNQMLRVRQG